MGKLTLLWFLNWEKLQKQNHSVRTARFWDCEIEKKFGSLVCLSFQ